MTKQSEPDPLLKRAEELATNACRTLGKYGSPTRHEEFPKLVTHFHAELLAACR